MTDLILIERKDLRELISEMFPKQPEPEVEQKEFLPFKEGVRYVNEKGVPLSESKAYKLTAEKEIPFRRFGGKKIVFLPQELDRWITEKLSVKENKVLKTVASSARRKEKA